MRTRYEAACMEWVYDILKEYVVKENIVTSYDRLDKVYEYMIDSGYGTSVEVVAFALVADSKIREMLVK